MVHHTGNGSFPFPIQSGNGYKHPDVLATEQPQLLPSKTLQLILIIDNMGNVQEWGQN